MTFLRGKPRSSGRGRIARLNAQAHGVNFVWNYCNETQQKAARARRKWLSGHDLWKLLAGATKEGLDLHSHSAMRVRNILRVGQDTLGGGAHV